MTIFEPAHQALLLVERLLALQPNDPAVVVALDALVLCGHLKPFVLFGGS